MKPSEPGFYWGFDIVAHEGKSFKSKYNLILEIYGESPFLRIRAWNRLNNSIQDYHPSKIIFGPKIEEPVRVKKEI